MIIKLAKTRTGDVFRTRKGRSLYKVIQKSTAGIYYRSIKSGRIFFVYYRKAAKLDINIVT